MSDSLGWYSRGYIPHFDAPEAIQHITFHLADSLPADALERMHDELPRKIDRTLDERKLMRLENLLHAGYGSCILRAPRCARIVEETLLFGDGTRYRLLSWAIMPNHVHVLIREMPGWPLGKVVQSWKRHSAREIHRAMDRRGDGADSTSTAGAASRRAGNGPASDSPSATRRNGNRSERRFSTSYPALWQREYWDRFVRDENHLSSVVEYIEQNPVAADLVASSEKWRWGSAWHKGRV